MKFLGNAKQWLTPPDIVHNTNEDDIIMVCMTPHCFLYYSPNGDWYYVYDTDTTI